MVSYIDDNKAHYGVEPICNVLPIAPSTYYDYKAKQRQPERRSEREKRDDVLNAVPVAVAWFRQAQTDKGTIPGTTTEEKTRIKALEKEVKELRRANEILKTASAFFAQAELDRKLK